MFEAYGGASGGLEVSVLQGLSYDLGRLLSRHELQVALRRLLGPRAVPHRLCYEDFLSWWRSRDDFRSLYLDR